MASPVTETVKAAARLMERVDNDGYTLGETLVEMVDPDNPSDRIYRKVAGVDVSTAFPVIDDDGSHPAARLVIVLENT